MGCWDAFCFICGNPCHSLLLDYLKDYLEIVMNKNIKDKPFMRGKNKKIKENPDVIEKLTKLEKNTIWMNKCTMLLKNDKIVHGVKENSCNINFCKNSKCYRHGHSYSEDLFYSPWGVFIHTDCWKYIKINYKIELKFSNLPKIIDRIKNPLFDFTYGEIKNYWGQDFDFINLCIDNKQYLCSSPLKNDKNIPQIKKIISQLKIKNNPERKGPAISATFFNTNDIKLGNNKKFWIIKNNKWVEINEKIIKMKVILDLDKLNNKQRKYAYSMCYQAETSNTDPVFIISSKPLKQKNTFEIEFVLTESYKDELMKHLTVIK